MRLPKPRNGGRQILRGTAFGNRADDLTSELNVDPTTASSGPRSGLLGNSAFMVILIATSVSSVGLAMFDTGSAWLMTSLNPSPRLVSAVQVATTLPLFLLTLPAGALSDVVDPRRLLIVAEAIVTVISVIFAAVVSYGLGSPALAAWRPRSSWAWAGRSQRRRGCSSRRSSSRGPTSTARSRSTRRATMWRGRSVRRSPDMRS